MNLKTIGSIEAISLILIVLINNVITDSLQTVIKSSRFCLYFKYNLLFHHITNTIHYYF